MWVVLPCGAPVSLFGWFRGGHLVTEIHTTRARLSTVLLKPPPTHPKVANTGPWLAGTAMEVAAWLRLLLYVPSGDEDEQHPIIHIRHIFIIISCYIDRSSDVTQWTVLIICI